MNISILKTDSGKNIIKYHKQGDNDRNKIILDTIDIEKIVSMYHDVKEKNIIMLDRAELEDISCRALGISKKMLYSKSRRYEIVLARYIVFAVLYITGYGSFPTLGRIYGKNHASVLHGVEEVLSIIKNCNKKFKDYRFEYVKTVLDYYHMWDHENNKLQNGYLEVINRNGEIIRKEITIYESVK